MEKENYEDCAYDIACQLADLYLISMDEFEKICSIINNNLFKYFSSKEEISE